MAIFGSNKPMITDLGDKQNNFGLPPLLEPCRNRPEPDLRLSTDSLPQLVFFQAVAKFPDQFAMVK